MTALGTRVAVAATALLLGAACRGDDVPDTPSDAGSPPPTTGDAAAQSPPCGADGPEALAACIEQSRYVTDVTFVAAERTPGSAHWREVQALCATRLTELGYEVERQAYGTGVNVIGLRRGATAPDEMVLISAHYDHIANCAGADDNASGVAGTLETARVLAMKPHARTLAVACWDEEERRSDDASSTNGSKAYARRSRERGEKIVGNFVLESIGYASSEPNSQRLPDGFESLFAAEVKQISDNQWRGDFITVVLDAASHGVGQHLVTYARAVGLPIVLFELPMEKLGDPSDLRRSDHSPFWDEGYPGMMLVDTAEFRNPYYHCGDGPDTVDTLNHAFATAVMRATTAAAARTLAGP